MACPAGGAAAAGGAGASAAECAGVRSAAKLNCHLMLPVSVGARWGPDRSWHPHRAVLPSSAAEIREFLGFVHSGVGSTQYWNFFDLDRSRSAESFSRNRLFVHLSQDLQSGL